MSDRWRNSFGEPISRIEGWGCLLKARPFRQSKDLAKLLQEQLAQFTASSPEMESIRQELMTAREEAATCRRKLQHREELCTTGSDAETIRESEEKSKQIQSLQLQVDQANTVSRQVRMAGPVY